MNREVVARFPSVTRYTKKITNVLAEDLGDPRRRFSSVRFRSFHPCFRVATPRLQPHRVSSPLAPSRSPLARPNQVTTATIR